MEIIIAGDFCERYRVAENISNKQFDLIFHNDVVQIIKQSDYSIVNFEFPIVKTKEKPIKKCGPNLKGTTNSVDAIKYSGFKCCTLANNHILDQGEQCGIDTMSLLMEAGIDVVGFGINAFEAAKTLYKTINGKTLAIINCCEHEFSVATESSAGSYGLNSISQFHSIVEARKNADNVLVIVHGGHEHFNIPSPRMIQLYRFFIEAGADAVINHHQHCYSGFELYNGKPIFYGIGNFLFDNPNHRNDYWNYGYMVRLYMNDNQISFDIIPYSQCRDTPCVELLYDKYTFNDNLKKINEIIADDKKLKLLIYDYYHKSTLSELDILEPYFGRFFSKLLDLNFVPRFIVKKKVAAILNHVECESHRDKLIFALTAKNK